MMIPRGSLAAVAVVLVAACGIAALARQGGAQVDSRIAGLIASLDSQAWEKAVEELVGIGQAAVDPLVAALRSGKGIAAARSCLPLARIGTGPAVDAVLEALSAADPAIREHAATALAWVKSDRSVTALIAAVQKEPWPRQAAAIHSLGALGDPRAAEPLAGLLTSRAWYVRDAAIRAIAQLDGPAAIGTLVAALGDEHGLVRQSAREGLVAGGEPAVPEMVRVLAAGTETVRWQAAWVLGRIKAPGTEEPLLGALEHGAPAVRLESAVSLARLGTGKVVDGLTRLLTSRDPAVREEAASLLGHLGSPRAAQPLVAALGDADAGWMAAVALGRLGIPSAATPLAAALENPSARTRRGAALALASLRAAGTVSALRRALGDPDEEVRYWAAEALRGIGTPEAAHAAKSARPTRWDRDSRPCTPPRSSATIESGTLTHNERRYRLYPETLETAPDIPSPLTTADGTELIVTVTSNGKYGIVPVTLKVGDRQCEADGNDFPTLARSGLHSEVELDRTRTITGRSVAEIAELGRPGYLSDDGFLAVGEHVVSIMKDDDRIVRALGLTHPDLARPLFHVWNAMTTDLDLGRWNMAEHRWGNVTGMVSHGRSVQVAAGDTKGGQLSIFADGIEGSFWIEISRDLTASEQAFLKKRYGHLEPRQLDALVSALTRMRTGEIQPHYVAWYGFYEGRTPWRVNPIAIALVFGLRTLDQIEAAFPGRLYEVMMDRYAATGRGVVEAPDR